MAARPSLRDQIFEIARSLPPAPKVLTELGDALRDNNVRLEDVARLVKRDAAFAAEIIRVSNGSLFRTADALRLGTIEEAIARIGLGEVYWSLGHITIKRLVERALGYYGVSAEALRENMVRTALACEALAIQCGLEPRQAYTAGLLRPLGIVILDRLADRLPRVEAYVHANDGDYAAWEGRAVGLTNCEIAGLVLEEWRFPGETIDAVRAHYLGRSDDFQNRLACVLNLAGCLVAGTGHALPGELRFWAVTSAKLEALGLDEASFQQTTERVTAIWKGFSERHQTEEERLKSKSAPLASDQNTCNSAPSDRVLETNDDSPVHTPPSGLIPPADFTTFMHAYQDMVFSTAARLTGNEAQAEDISQEVFLKAHAHFDSLRTSPTAGGWLKTVATNLSLNHLSRYRNRWKFFSEFKRDDSAAESEAPEVEFAAPDTFFSGVDAEERRAWVERALDELPHHQRVPLVLYHFEDMPYDEIARKLNVSLAKVKTDILRARAALGKILQRGRSAHETIEN
jgi:RNA polymerase sigma-70 factor (ECF subfamily)